MEHSNFKWIKRAPAAFLLSFLVCTYSLTAQTREYITLNQAIETALENNRLLAAQRQKLKAADWAVKRSYTEYLPKVSFNQRLTRVDDFSVTKANFAIEGLKSFPGFEDVDIPPFLFKDTYQTNFEIRQSIYTGGRLSNMLETSKIYRESERLNLKDNEAEIMLQVTQAYYSLAQSQDFIQVQRKSLELAERNLQNARTKNELGLRPRSDILRWEAQVASEESRLIEAENAASIAQVNLVNTIGADLFMDVEIDIISESDFTEKRKVYENFTEGGQQEQLHRLFNLAVLNNPGRKNISLQKTISESAIKIARSNFLPQVSFNYSYAWQGNDTPKLDGFKEWSATINISYSLFNGFTEVAELQKAKAEKKQVELQEQDFDRRLKVAIFTAYKNIRTAITKIVLAEKNLLQVTDNLELVQNRYGLGLASNIDLVDAQVLETNARVNLITARYDLLIAGAELENLTGKPIGTN